MNNLINASVMQGLVGAHCSVQFANVSMRIYEQAKTQGNGDVAERALGYATDSMTDAQKYNEDAKDALLEAKETAREEEKKSQQAELEHSAESAAENAANSAAEKAPSAQASLETQTAIHLTHATDRLELSEQGREAALSRETLSAEQPAGPPSEQPSEQPAKNAAGEKRSIAAQAHQRRKPAEIPNRGGNGKAISKAKARFSARA